MKDIAIFDNFEPQVSITNQDKLLKTQHTLCCAFLRANHRDILLEANSSQNVCASSVSTGDQGGEPTLGHCNTGDSVTEFDIKLKFLK
jgi:hypothetical protein